MYLARTDVRLWFHKRSSFIKTHKVPALFTEADMNFKVSVVLLFFRLTVARFKDPDMHAESLSSRFPIARTLTLFHNVKPNLLSKEIPLCTRHPSDVKCGLTDLKEDKIDA